jgi:hypothetical protein
MPIEINLESEEQKVFSWSTTPEGIAKAINQLPVMDRIDAVRIIVESVDTSPEPPKDSSKLYQFIYCVYGQELKEKYHVVEADCILAACEKFAAWMPKDVVKVDYEVGHNGGFIDISDIQCLNHII